MHVKKSYKDSILQLYRYIYKCENQKDCCELETESRRFQWCKEYFCPKVALLLSLSALFSLSTDFFEKNSVHVHIKMLDNDGIGFFVGLSPATLESPGDSKEHTHTTESMY